MILAAGRGERLRPITDITPKPLVGAGGKPLIEWQLEKLQRAGVKKVVINLSYLAEQIESALGDGSRYGVRIRYSREIDGALESGGGIVKALPLLGPGSFILLNADIWSEFDLSTLEEIETGGHLVLVDPPAPHLSGDFALEHDQVRNSADAELTYAGIAVLTPSLFEGCAVERFPLAPLLQRAADSGLLSGEHYGGVWFDAGTHERLQALQNHLDSIKG